MRLLVKLSTVALVLSLGAPSAFAKIYPDDFMILDNGGSASSTPATTSSSSSSVSGTTDSGAPFFFASEIADGKLTRAQFIDALATRLYDGDAHDNCFADLVLSQTYNYNLLFNDVSLDASYASSICVAMRNGLIRGYSDGTFRPDAPMTVAEAAATFGRLGGTPLRDSNHVKPGEAWYQRFMDAMRAVDNEFTMKPYATLTGVQLKHSLCVLKGITPQVDPLDEFAGCR